MIEALFNQPYYLSAKKTLEATEVRQQAIASNIANLETPGYKRVDLAPSFETALEKASASGDVQSLNSLQPTVTVDAAAAAASKDGNNVNLEKELMLMNQNSMTHAFDAQMIGEVLTRMRTAINGQ